MSKHAIKPLVMLVDDEQPILDMCRLFLEHAGFEVRTYSDCHSAKKAIENSEIRYNVLVSDSSFSKTSGVECYIDNEVISASREKYPNIPIISISGYPEKPALADVHLTKPFNPDRLVLIINSHLISS